METSTGEMVQGWAPDAMVVKAFNTLVSATMADPASAGGSMSIPIAGNDASAKMRVASLVTGIGFEVVDFGFAIQFLFSAGSAKLEQAAFWLLRADYFRFSPDIFSSTRHTLAVSSLSIPWLIAAL
jgi:hypothetical protein